MAALSVPEDGLVLLRTPEHSPASNPALSLQVMRLTLAKKTTEDILKSFQTKEKVSIRFGKRVTVQHGKKTHPVFSYLESNPSELYRRSIDEPNTFYFSGKLSHRLETQRAQTDTAKADEALANLENSLKSYEEQKASNEARFVTDKEELRHLTEASQKGRGNLSQPSAIRKDRLLNTINRSGPSSPFSGAANSPGIGPTSATRSVPTSIGKDQSRLNAIKIPLLHLLAVRPLTPKLLVETIYATKDDCEKLLHKHGKEVREADGKQELKDKAYRELDVWKFPYPSENDRQAAIDRAISAFDRMRISTSDAIWETLLPVKGRGKGKGSELSRLKIGQGGMNGVTPKPGLGKGDVRNMTDTETDNGKPAGKAKKPTTKARPRSGTNEDQEKISTTRKEATKQIKEARSKETTRKEKKRAPPAGKFKSSEVIEDSDEELEGAKISIEHVKKSNKELNTKVKSPATIQQPKSATTGLSNKSTMSSSKAPSKAVSGLMPSSALSRPRSESTTKKGSPRPRTDSSPQKPSPLASSPPTNATDLDNSQSSKPNSLSSATSSPDMSPRHDRSQKATATSKATSDSKLPASTLKRKASDQPSPAPKRQQQPNGTHVARPTSNGITKSQPHKTTTTTTSSSSQRSRTPSSSSASTSTTSRSSAQPTSDRSTSDLQHKSRRFKIQYARYQTLHAKIMALPERERDVEEVRLLRRMHGRIGELKREIWEGWERERMGMGAGMVKGR
jgi:RNA polymerase II elongation factor ELL